MSTQFSGGNDRPTSRDGEWSLPRAGHSLRWPMLNWVHAALLSILVLAFVVLTGDPARDEEESAAWTSPTRHPEGTHWTVAFSPDGRLLANGGEDGGVVLREIENGIEKELSGDCQGRVVCLAFSPDGSTLAVGYADSTVSLWDVGTCEKRTTLRGHSNLVKCLAFSPDGKILAGAGDDPCIRVWDIESGETKRTLLGHRGSVCTVFFAPDGSTLASSCAGGMVKLWELSSGASRELIGPSHRNQAVLGLSFSPDGTMLASGSVCDGLRLWDVATGRVLAMIRSENTSVREVKFSRDGRMLVEVRTNGLVVIWELATRHQSTLQTNCSTSYCSSVSVDARFLAMGDADGILRVWDLTHVPKAGAQ